MILTKSYEFQVGGFRVLRLIRLLRILKLFRHSPGSQTMIQFLITSIPEIILLLLMWSIGILMFGPLLYFVEQGNDEFTSAFSGYLLTCHFNKTIRACFQMMFTPPPPLRGFNKTVNLSHFYVQFT